MKPYIMKPYTGLYCSMPIGLLEKQGGFNSYSSVSHSVDEKDQADYTNESVTIGMNALKERN